MKYLFSLLLVLICFSPSSFAQQLSQTDKLYATCKVWGFLKYYHPRVADGKFDIDQHLFKLLPEIESANSKEEFSSILNEWILSFGKIKSNIKSSEHTHFEKNFNLKWLEDDKYFSKELTKTLKLIETNRHQGKKYYVASHKTTGAAIMTNELSHKGISWQEKDYRLLCLFRYWNFTEYFFPYKYQTDKKWDIVLREMIPLFTDAESEIEYHLAMLSLVASINDSHASFVTKNTFNHFGNKFVPFVSKIFGDKAIVVRFLDESLSRESDIQIGDIITRVNGLSIDSIFHKNQKFTMGSNLPAQLNRAHSFIFNGSTDSLAIQFERDDQIQTKWIRRYLWNDIKKEETKDQFKYQIYDNNIGYINLGNIDKEEFTEIMQKVIQTKSLIIDLRFGLNHTSQMIANFITSKESFFYSQINPDLDYPGKFIWTKGNYEKGSNNPAYKGKVVLLVNESTQSNSEYTAMWLQSDMNVITVGSQTSGADGNITEFEMVGGFPTRFTGIGIFYPDGTETQRKGVKIDIEVRPTIQGVSEGKDEQLEKAIEVANEEN